MFLRCKKRWKDGKEHLYWSIVENCRVAGGRILQRHVLHLGELNGRQEASWRKTVDLFDHDEASPRQVSLFPEEHLPGGNDPHIPNVVTVSVTHYSGLVAASVGAGVRAASHLPGVRVVARAAT